MEPPSTKVEILQLSSLLGAPLLTTREERRGRIQDLIAHLGKGQYPTVSGLLARVADQEVFVPVEDVDSLGAEGALLSARSGDLGRFVRRPGEMLLGRDLRAHHLIDVKRAKLVRANEIEVARIDGRLMVVGVDPSWRPVARRMLPRRLRRRIRSGAMVDWRDIEPFVGHVPTARLRIPFPKLARLHPAQLADLVEEASQEEGEELIRALSSDRGLEADVFEELDPGHQLKFLRSRTDAEAASLLAAMAPDDAVDLLMELEQERRLPILERLPSDVRNKLRGLLEYNPETAGGLMSPDFVTVAPTKTVGDALDLVRRSKVAPEGAGVLFVTDFRDRLLGTVSVVELLRQEPHVLVQAVTHEVTVALRADFDLRDIVRQMTDFNLASAPVVDSEGKMIGQITVDDVLELVLPPGWRRDHGLPAS